MNMVSVVKKRKGGVFIIDCVKLKTHRQQYGCSADLLAKLGGWKKSWQSYLEKLEERQVNLETILKIYHTLGLMEGLEKDTAYFLNRSNSKEISNAVPVEKEKR